MMSVACSKCSAPTKPSNAQKDLTQALQRTLTSEISVKNSNPHAAGAGRLEDPTGLRYAPRPVRWTWGRRPESRDRAKLGSCDLRGNVVDEGLQKTRTIGNSRVLGFIHRPCEQIIIQSSFARFRRSSGVVPGTRRVQCTGWFHV